MNIHHILEISIKQNKYKISTLNLVFKGMKLKEKVKKCIGYKQGVKFILSQN